MGRGWVGAKKISQKKRKKIGQKRFNLNNLGPNNCWYQLPFRNIGKRLKIAFPDNTWNKCQCYIVHLPGDALIYIACKANITISEPFSSFYWVYNVLVRELLWFWGQVLFLMAYGTIFIDECRAFLPHEKEIFWFLLIELLVNRKQVSTIHWL